ncbi:MAG TPA: ACP synthase [Myxococcales bacterium]|jgi:hypothetical protein
MDEALDIGGLRNPTCSRRSLERLRAGELRGDEAAAVRAHAAGCARCGAELAALEKEAAQFKAEIPFEKFAAAVERKQAMRKRGKVAGPVSLALAAGIALILVWGPMKGLLGGGAQQGHHLTKGGSAVELFVGGTGAAPRLAQEGEALAPGERVRVGYLAPDKAYVLILSVDEAGVATPLYPEAGPSLPVEKGAGTHLMPLSLELTGAGLERIIALFSDQPIEMRTALEAASKEFTRAGKLERMAELPLGAEQSAKTLKKPQATK